MSEHKAVIRWKKTSEDFGYETYNREHEWAFENGQTLKASAAPEFKGSPDCVDPEEAFTASVASCHMLTFLALASKRRLVVEEYTDNAAGFLEKNAEGKMAITRIELRPKITFAAGTEVSAEKLAQLHEQAHQYCFVANSIKADVRVAA